LGKLKKFLQHLNTSKIQFKIGTSILKFFKVNTNMLKCGQNQEQEQDFHPAKAGRGDGGRVLDANDAAVQYAAAGNIKIS